MLLVKKMKVSIRVTNINMRICFLKEICIVDGVEYLNVNCNLFLIIQDDKTLLRLQTSKSVL